jgi:NTP pyrophosphatase (non-canonical NTP hydrolase)
MGGIDVVIEKLNSFRKERDWEKFHNPKDLSLAISIEAGELLELFLWKEADSVDRVRIEEEIADIFSYLLLMSEHYDINLVEATLKKIESNRIKYPVDKSKGTSKKYNEL